MGICILGMGDCNTETSTDISDITRNNVEINNSIKNKINQDCNQTTLQSNTINIIGSNVKKLSATQKNSLQSMCIMQSILKSTTNADVVNNLMSKIKENLKSEGSVLGSPSSNKTVIKKLQENSTKVDNSKFNEISKQCILNTTQKNLLNIIGSTIEDTTTDQANEAFLKCLSQHSDDTGIDASVLSDTKNDTDITSSASGGDVGKSIGSAAKGIGEGVGTAAKGIGEGVGAGIGGIVSAYMTPIMIICGCILVISLASMAFMFMKPGATSQLAQTATTTAASIRQMYPPMGAMGGMPSMGPPAYN
jgi:hypothetical protein